MFRCLLELAKALVNHEEFKELSKEFSMAIAAVSLSFACVACFHVLL